MDIKFTGERYIPSEKGQIRYEHLHRYSICLDLVAGKSVVDIACGEGYGSSLLSKAAKSVIGVDISPECISHANNKYGNKNITFLLGSCESIPVESHSIDVVISFETIEHHDKHEEMMLEITRVLKPSGVLIISSPNRLTYSDEANYSNPFHVKELYYEELVSLLGNHFEYIKVYGQRLAIGSFIFPLEDSQKKEICAYNEKGNLFSSLKSPIYFVVLCSNDLVKIQSSLESLYIDKSDDLLNNLLKSFEIQSQSQNQQFQNIIAGMESSIFWKIRNIWFKIKNYYIGNK